MSSHTRPINFKDIKGATQVATLNLNNGQVPNQLLNEPETPRLTK